MTQTTIIILLISGILIFGYSILDYKYGVENEYASFQRFLIQDNVSEHIFIDDDSNPYIDNYVCAHYTIDLIHSARNNGYEIYPALLTNDNINNIHISHAIAIILLDGIWYLVEPQTDEIIPINKLCERYHYNYIYTYKDFYMGRNNIYTGAKLEQYKLGK